MEDFGDLDSILDDALDEFDRDEKTQQTQQPPPVSAEASDEYAQFKTFMDKLAPALAGGASEETLNSLMAEMTKVKVESEESSPVVFHTTDTSITTSASSSSSSTTPATPTTTVIPITEEKESKTTESKAVGFTSGVEQAVKELSTPSSKPSSTAEDPMADLLKGLPPDANLEEMLKNVLANFDSDESAPELDKMMESIVGEMFSKENLEGPLKEIIAKYPPYMEKNKAKLTGTELTNCQNQYSCFVRMAALLDAGAPHAQLTDLLNEMQNYGQVPEEITGPTGNPFGGGGPNPFAGGMPPGMPPLTSEEQEAMKKMANECPTM